MKKIKILIATIVGGVVLCGIGLVMLLPYAVVSDSRYSTFLGVTSVLGELVYRSERGIDTSASIKQFSLIELPEHVNQLSEVSCKTNISFPEVRDPTTYQQVELVLGPMSKSDIFFGKFISWVFYQGPPVNFQKYLDPANTAEFETLLNQFDKAGTYVQRTGDYNWVVNEYEIDVQHIACEGYSISIIKTY